MRIAEMEIYDPEIGLGLGRLGSEKLPSPFASRWTKIQCDVFQQILGLAVAIGPELDPDHGCGAGGIRHSPMSAHAMDPALLTV